MRIVACVFLVSLIGPSGCSEPKASSNISAAVIAAPLSGYTCFALLDDTGKAVGGNCVKD